MLVPFYAFAFKLLVVKEIACLMVTICELVCLHLFEIVIY